MSLVFCNLTMQVAYGSMHAEHMGWSDEHGRQSIKDVSSGFSSEQQSVPLAFKMNSQQDHEKQSMPVKRSDSPTSVAGLKVSSEQMNSSGLESLPLRDLTSSVKKIRDYVASFVSDKNFRSTSVEVVQGNIANQVVANFGLSSEEAIAMQNEVTPNAKDDTNFDTSQDKLTYVRKFTNWVNALIQWCIDKLSSPVSSEKPGVSLDLSEANILFPVIVEQSVASVIDLSQAELLQNQTSGEPIEATVLQEQLQPEVAVRNPPRPGFLSQIKARNVDRQGSVQDEQRDTLTDAVKPEKLQVQQSVIYKTSVEYQLALKKAGAVAEEQAKKLIAVEVNEKFETIWPDILAVYKSFRKNEEIPVTRIQTLKMNEKNKMLEAAYLEKANVEKISSAIEKAQEEFKANASVVAPKKGTQKSSNATKKVSAGADIEAQAEKAFKESIIDQKTIESMKREELWKEDYGLDYRNATQAQIGQAFNDYKLEVRMKVSNELAQNKWSSYVDEIAEARDDAVAKWNKEQDELKK